MLDAFQPSGLVRDSLVLQNAEFETFFNNHRDLDKIYSSTILSESFRYGITAGVSPSGYHADSIQNHPDNVFSPEAVAAWGDMDTFLDFYDSQFPTSDLRYRYGLLRESATQPTWVPNDAGLVDHLFLHLGLVESIDAEFFADRVFLEFIFGDTAGLPIYNAAGVPEASSMTIVLITCMAFALRRRHTLNERSTITG